MKKILTVMTALALLLMPFTVYSQSGQKSAGAPPISQALVSEGDFALKLAAALKLGAPNDEAQAEDMLTSAGIAPKNGWIADYPLTPNIIGELQDSVATAADSKNLPMGKDEALKALQGLTTELGLAISPGNAGEYAENQPQPDASVINNYYYEEGPPVVSYYPPPWDYYYLYDWVPYPFWASGFFFPGFFVLTDFDFVFVGHHHHHHRITNHFFNHRTHAFGRVDPVRHAWTSFSHTTAFNATANRNAASSIFNRSRDRTTFSRGTHGVVTNNRGNTAGGRTFGNSSRFATGGGMNHRSSQSFGRSFSVPPSHGSSGCVNCHGSSSSFGRSSGRSFSGFSGGHSSGGFSSSHASGGFSGAHSSGGFSGGHSSGGFSGGHSSGGFSGGGHGGGGGRR
jgi:hypothetical protein